MLDGSAVGVHSQAVGLKINAGCGSKMIDGWVNVDAVANKDRTTGKPTDIVADLRSIPLPDGCADTLAAFHVVEHFYRWEVPDVLAEWRRLLQPNGLLILELPNVELSCRNVLDGQIDQLGMWGLYGDPKHKDPFMCHRWGWTPVTLKDELERCGFTGVKQKPPQTHGVRTNRDMRLEARRL
jgi:predicted SAM-dependent methyltransferase